jgi:uncharacterized membrane protein
MRAFMSRHPRTVAVVSTTSGLLGLTTVAFASFVLTTTISGSTAFADSTAAIKVTAASVTHQQGGVTCAANVKNDESVQVEPKVRRVTSGSGSATVPGSCKISLTLHNTGTEPLELRDASFTAGPPPGWSLSRSSFSGATKLAGGASGTLSAVVTASDAATAGPFSFKITWMPHETAR